MSASARQTGSARDLHNLHTQIDWAHVLTDKQEIHHPTSHIVHIKQHRQILLSSLVQAMSHICTASRPTVLSPREEMTDSLKILRRQAHQPGVIAAVQAFPVVSWNTILRP